MQKTSLPRSNYRWEKDFSDRLLRRYLEQPMCQSLTVPCKLVGGCGAWDCEAEN